MGRKTLVRKLINVVLGIIIGLFSFVVLVIGSLFLLPNIFPIVFLFLPIISLVIAIFSIKMLNFHSMRDDILKAEKRLSSMVPVNVEEMNLTSFFRNHKKIENSKPVILQKLYEFAVNEQWDSFKELLETLKELNIHIYKSEIYKFLVSKAIGNRIISIDKFLERLREILEINDYIIKNTLSGILRNFITEEFMSLFEYEYEEVSDTKLDFLENLIDAVEGLDNVSEEIKDQLNDLYDMYLVVSQPLEPIPCSIRLKRSEICYSEIHGVKLRKWRKKKIGYAGAGISFKLTKRIRIYTGGGKVVETMDVLVVDDVGSIYITNKRFIFTGEKRTISLKWDKILDINIYKDSNLIEIIRDSGPVLVFEFATIRDLFEYLSVTKKLFQDDEGKVDLN